jgi:hypothetical protein
VALLKACRNRNIVAFLGEYVDSEKTCLIMEYMEVCAGLLLLELQSKFGMCGLAGEKGAYKPHKCVHIEWITTCATSSLVIAAILERSHRGFCSTHLLLYGQRVACHELKVVCHLAQAGDLYRALQKSRDGALCWNKTCAAVSHC